MSDELLKAEIDNYKQESLEQRFAITQLTERLARIEQENLRLIQQKQDSKDTSNKDIKGLKDIIGHLEKDLEKHQGQIYDYEINIQRFRINLQEKEKEYKRAAELDKQQFDMEQRELQQKNDMLEQELEGIQNFSQLKIELENEKQNLSQALELEREDKQRELADKEREKVQATDKLQKDMLHKIQETKTSLLALKKEQLQTTTRLTVLQNHQLTTELEYQSKQTEKLLFKNSKLQEQINALKRDVEIHKQVEQELAKRSHFCQKLIQKLSQRIQQLEQQNEQKNQDLQENQEQNEGEGAEQQKDELIDQLEKHIENLQKQMAKFQNRSFIGQYIFQDNEILKNENFYLKSRIDSTEIRYSNLATILAQNLESLQNDQQGVYDMINENNQIKLVLDLNEIKSQPVTEWTGAEKETIFTLLLEQIKPLISINHQNLIQKKNLLTGPNEMKNINISIIEEQNKDPIILPSTTLKINLYKSIQLMEKTLILMGNQMTKINKISGGSKMYLLIQAPKQFARIFEIGDHQLNPFRKPVFLIYQQTNYPNYKYFLDKQNLNRRFNPNPN